MAREFDAEHIVNLAFQPIRRWVDTRRRQCGRAVREPGFEADPQIPREAVHDVNEIEPFGPIRIVNCRNVNEIVELEIMF